ncbi:hypothetical protein EDD17DRAFT_1657624 [Pisolithus thermaeus]|nr:hypothetical protein EDD17DRAFT_1657624 [Pisolithus thermaeus]
MLSATFSHLRLGAPTYVLIGLLEATTFNSTVNDDSRIPRSLRFLEPELGAKHQVCWMQWSWPVRPTIPIKVFGKA